MRVNGHHGHSASGNREGQCREGNDLLHGWLPVRQGCRGDGVPHSVPNVAKLAWDPSRAPLPVRLLKVYVGIDRRAGSAIAACRMLAVIYVLRVCVVATICLWLLGGNLDFSTEPPFQNVAKCFLHRVPYSNMKSVSRR
jgi:hypothetical protein